MNLSNSNLFKEFARPALQKYHELTNEGGKATMSRHGVLDTVFQFLMNRSKLEILLVHITDATEDAYKIRVEARVTNTGPVSSTISSMELDIGYNTVSHGRMTFPEFVTHAGGTNIAMPEQQVTIADMGAYMAFVKSVIRQKETQFQLDNGVCKVKALGLTANCDFYREFSIAGMDGPKGIVEDVIREGNVVEVKTKCFNPSPVEINHGTTIFQFLNDKEETLAEARGNVNILRGEFSVILIGELREGMKGSPKMRFKGVGAEGSTWCNETAKFVDVEVDVKPELLQILDG